MRSRDASLGGGRGPVERECSENDLAVPFKRVERAQHRRQDLLGDVGRVTVIFQLRDDRVLPFDAIIRLGDVRFRFGKVLLFLDSSHVTRPFLANHKAEHPHPGRNG